VCVCVWVGVCVEEGRVNRPTSYTEPGT